MQIWRQVWAFCIMFLEINSKELKKYVGTRLNSHEFKSYSLYLQNSIFYQIQQHCGGAFLKNLGVQANKRELGVFLRFFGLFFLKKIPSHVFTYSIQVCIVLCIISLGYQYYHQHSETHISNQSRCMLHPLFKGTTSDYPF